MDNSSQTISAPIALGPGAALSAEAGKPAVKPLWQRLLGAGAKLAISAALIWLVCRNIDLRGLGERFVGQSPAWLVAAAVATLAQIPLAALRWSQILRALDLAIPGRTIFSISWIGSFFNSWLLGNGSGDVARALVAPPDTRGRAALVHSVLFDRAISFGGVALAILPVVALGLGPLSRGTPTLVSLAIVAAPFLAMFWVEPLAPLMVRWRLPFAGLLDGLVQSWQRLRRARGRVLLALTAAVMSEVALTFTAYALARAQHLEVSFTDFLVLMPPVLLLGALPISIGGWGVRENVLVLALAPLGVAAGPALLVGLEIGLMGSLVSLPGGAIWLFGHVLRRRR